MNNPFFNPISLTWNFRKVGQLIRRVRQLTQRLIIFWVLTNLSAFQHFLNDVFDVYINIKVLQPFIQNFQSNNLDLVYVIRWIYQFCLTNHRSIELILLFGLFECIFYILKAPILVPVFLIKNISNSYLLSPFVEKATVIFNKCRWVYNRNAKQGGLISAAYNFVLVCFILLRYLPGLIYTTKLFDEVIYRFFRPMGNVIHSTLSFPFLALAYLGEIFGIRDARYYSIMENSIITVYQILHYFDNVIMTLMLALLLFVKVFSFLRSFVEFWSRYHTSFKEGEGGRGVNPYKNPLIYMLVEQFDKFLDGLRYPMISHRNRDDENDLYDENTPGPKIKIGDYYYKLEWAGPLDYKWAVFSSNAEWPFPVRVAQFSPDYKWYQYVVGYLNQALCGAARKAAIGFVVTQTMYSLMGYIEMGGTFGFL